MVPEHSSSGIRGRDQRREVGNMLITRGPSGLMAVWDTRTRTSFGFWMVGVGRVLSDRMERGVPRVVYVQARIVGGISKGGGEEDMVGRCEHVGGR